MKIDKCVASTRKIMTLIISLGFVALALGIVKHNQTKNLAAYQFFEELFSAAMAIQNGGWTHGQPIDEDQLGLDVSFPAFWKGQSTLFDRDFK